jgi:hypothetical protein
MMNHLKGLGILLIAQNLFFITTFRDFSCKDRLAYSQVITWVYAFYVSIHLDVIRVSKSLMISSILALIYALSTFIVVVVTPFDLALLLVLGSLSVVHTFVTGYMDWNSVRVDRVETLNDQPVV